VSNRSSLKKRESRSFIEEQEVKFLAENLEVNRQLNFDNRKSVEKKLRFSDVHEELFFDNEKVFLSEESNKENKVEIKSNNDEPPVSIILNGLERKKNELKNPSIKLTESPLRHNTNKLSFKIVDEIIKDNSNNIIVNTESSDKEKNFKMLDNDNIESPEISHIKMNNDLPEDFSNIKFDDEAEDEDDIKLIKKTSNDSLNKTSSFKQSEISFEEEIKHKPIVRETPSKSVSVNSKINLRRSTQFVYPDTKRSASVNLSSQKTLPHTANTDLDGSDVEVKRQRKISKYHPSKPKISINSNNTETYLEEDFQEIRTNSLIKKLFFTSKHKSYR
jgi:hypothetical protein